MGLAPEAFRNLGLRPSREEPESLLLFGLYGAIAHFASRDLSARAAVSRISVMSSGKSFSPNAREYEAAWLVGDSGPPKNGFAASDTRFTKLMKSLGEGMSMVLSR